MTSPGRGPPSYSSMLPGSGPTRRPSYASVLTRQSPTNNWSPNTLPNAYTRYSNTNLPPSILGTSSHSYPPPQPIQHQHRNSDAAELYNTPDLPWTRDQLQAQSLTFEDNMASMMSGRSSDFFVPSYLMNSRYIERLEERHKARAAALAKQRENKSGPPSRVGSLSTTPSSMNLRGGFGSSSYRGVAFDIVEKPSKKDEDTTKPLPRRWNHADKWHGLELLSDGLEVKSTDIQKDDAASVRADAPVPKECGIYYYEITVLGKSKENQIGIGFSESKVKLEKLPGWEQNSWAYHSDDGFSFCQTASGKTYGPKFVYPDVIGCGINFKSGQIFYTRNGHPLGIAFRDVRSEALYPSIGMKKIGEHIKTNFGQSPFVFDIDGFVARERASLQEDIDATSLRSQIGHGTEANLLQEIVAQYLSQEGYTETAKAFNGEVRKNAALLSGNVRSLQNVAYKEDMDAVHRQRIRSAILAGDIDTALKHTNAFYPTVLQANTSIYFQLRCRKFVEMIRQCTLLQPRSKRHSVHRQSSSSLRAAAIGQRNSTHYDGGYSDVFDGNMELDEAHDGISATNANGNGERESEARRNSMVQQQTLMTEALQYGQELRAEFRDNISKEEQQTLDQTFALIAYPDARDSSLAHLLETDGRNSVAEELNGAILVSLGKASASAVERLVQQSEVLVTDLAKTGGGAALINVRADFMQ